MQREYIPSFISIDKLTNEVVAMKAENAFIPREIKGVELTEQEQNELREGKVIFLNDMPFKAEDVNRDELHDIGIMNDELELSGEQNTLLKGEKTKVMPLKLVLLGVDVVTDTTLQLVYKGEASLLGR